MQASTEIIQRIEEALNQVRPYLQADGGDVSFVELTPDNVVRIQLLGACKSCSMSMMTMKAGIEESVKRAVPQVIRVEAIGISETVA